MIDFLFSELQNKSFLSEKFIFPISQKLNAGKEKVQVEEEVIAIGARS